MALREFVGSDGRAWQVWDTRPTIQVPNVGAPSPDTDAASSDALADLRRVSKKREGGWLTFRANNERRRLSPIPDEWELSDDASLRTLLAAADVITGREEIGERSD